MTDQNPEPWGCGGPFGSWKVEAQTPEGQAYRGSLLLTRPVGPTVLAHWKTDIGEFTGLGLLHNGQLLLSRVAGGSPEGKEPGIVWYAMTQNGDLDAVWSIGSLAGQIGTGLATGGVPGKLEGRRTILYYLPDGNSSPPPLDINIYAHGETFAIEWRDGGQKKFDGVGLATPTGLASAWSPSEPAAVKTLLVMRSRTSGKALATSAIQGVGELGVERLTKE